jgi:ribonuclease P protein component
MIARTHRFHGYNSLRRVYTHGKVVRGHFFSLKYISNDRRRVYRAAVVVSRKVHKSAVVRNRIRRRMYEVIRTSVPKDALPTDLVFVVYAEQVADLPATELRRHMLSQLKKTGVFKK